MPEDFAPFVRRPHGFDEDAAAKDGNGANGLEQPEHAEVDIQHAAEGLADLEAYARYYGLANEDGLAIAQLTLRENVFLRRYFREEPLPDAAVEREGTPCVS